MKSNDFLSFREAEDRYATKTDVKEDLLVVAEIRTVGYERLSSRIDIISARIDAIVPRTEHVLHWEREDEKFVEMNRKLDGLCESVDALKSDKLPKWTIPVLVGLFGVCGPTVGIIVAHFLGR
ncbi:MAG: hypothetical protein ACREML_12505 [Vulcanimicrobiaceae bacterium]